MSTYIIAEIGVNHNGSITLAKEMIDLARESGANAVKFQIFKAKKLVSLGTPKVQYQKETTGTEQSHYDMIKSLELQEKDFLELKTYCDQIEIDFIATPYDVESADYLINSLKCKKIKIASADIVDRSLHQYLSTQSGFETIIATGMATMGEIERCLQIYRDQGNEHLENIHLLQCVSNYPCKIENLNLSSIHTITNSFKVPCGFSDHSNSLISGCLAVAHGAHMVEVHFTSDKNLPGPDHPASLDPAEFKQYCQNIRQAEKMKGDGIKKVYAEEMEMKKVSRKSLSYKSAFKRGHTLQEEDIIYLRPGTGLNESFHSQLIGKSLAKDVTENSNILMGDINW